MSSVTVGRRRVVRRLRGVTFTIEGQESRVWQRIEANLEDERAAAPAEAAKRPMRTRVRVGLAATVLVLITATLIVPPVRSLAQGFLVFLSDTLFPRSQSTAVAASSPLEGPLEILD